MRSILFRLFKTVFQTSESTSHFSYEDFSYKIMRTLNTENCWHVADEFFTGSQNSRL